MVEYHVTRVPMHQVGAWVVGQFETLRERGFRLEKVIKSAVGWYIG